MGRRKEERKGICTRGKGMGKGREEVQGGKKEAIKRIGRRG